MVGAGHGSLHQLWAQVRLEVGEEDAHIAEGDAAQEHRPQALGSAGEVGVASSGGEAGAATLGDLIKAQMDQGSESGADDPNASTDA